MVRIFSQPYLAASVSNTVKISLSWPTISWGSAPAYRSVNPTMSANTTEMASKRLGSTRPRSFNSAATSAGSTLSRSDSALARSAPTRRRK